MDTKVRFLVLMLTALLLAAGTAHATGPAPAPGATASEVEEEFEVIEEVEEEDPAEECAEAEVEFELGEIEQEEAEAFCEGVEGPGAGSSSAKCPLRSAHAHAATRHNMLKVTLGYTAYHPFQAKLRLTHHLGSLKRNLGRSGIVRFTKRLGHRNVHKFVLKLRPVGRAGCPSPRLVLFPK
jgi:hypothetical protein